MQRHEITLKMLYCRRAFRVRPLVGISAIVFEIGLVLYKRATGTLFFNHDLDLSGTLFNSIGVQAGWATPNPMVNNPTWYVSVLLLCYLIFYLVNYLAGKCHVNVNYLYFSIIFIGMGTLSYGINLPFINNIAGRGYYAFFFGIVLANFLSKHKKSINKYSIIAIMIISLTIYYIYYLQKNGQSFDDFYWLTFAFVPSFIILAETKVIRKIFSGRFWSLLAKSAYNVFIWHVCMEMLYKYLLFKYPELLKYAEWKMMLYALGIDWTVGILSYFLIEKPITKK